MSMGSPYRGQMKRKSLKKYNEKTCAYITYCFEKKCFLFSQRKIPVELLTILSTTMSHEQVVHAIQGKSLLIRGWDVYISKKAALDDSIRQPPCRFSQNILQQQESKDQRESTENISGKWLVQHCNLQRDSSGKINKFSSSASYLNDSIFLLYTNWSYSSFF